MEKVKVFIVGSGKLAKAIIDGILSTSSFEVIKWETQHKSLNGKFVVIHAGSGRQLNECIEFCARTKAVFIELSTGLDMERYDVTFPLVICPNISILVVKTLRMIKQYGESFENYEVSIIESHQATKITEPGTAYNFANFLKVDHKNILSIRDPNIQANQIGIPHDYLEKHAYHKIIIKDNKDELIIETKVLGHNSYVNGVRAIIDTCVTHKLKHKQYTVLDLIDAKML